MISDKKLFRTVNALVQFNYTQNTQDLFTARRHLDELINQELERHNKVSKAAWKTFLDQNGTKVGEKNE